MNIRISIFLGLGIFNFFCQPSEDKSSKEVKKQLNRIVCIFNKTDKISQSSIHYFDKDKAKFLENGAFTEYELDYQKTDTLTIFTRDSVNSIELFFKYVKYTYYPENGDTVSFHFSKGYPEVQILNSLKSNDEVNFSLNFKKKFQMPLVSDNVLRRTKDTLSAQEILQTNLNKIILYQKYVDSLYRLDKLSQVAKSIRSAEILGIKYALELTPSFERMISQDEKKQIDTFANNEKWLKYPFFHSFLAYRYLPSYLFKIPFKNSKSSYHLDYPKAYTIIFSRLKSSKVKHLLLMFCMQGIVETETQNISLQYLKRFKQDVSDSIYHSRIHDMEVMLNAVEVRNSSIKELYGAQTGVQITFKDYIQKHKGKIIYVDFWASWCVPCIGVMKDAALLRKEFSGKKVLFMYISLDNNMQSWRTSMMGNHIPLKESFVLINPKQSALVREFKIGNIPRYLIVNEQGKVIHKNAPGPDTKEIRKLLHALLINK